MDGVKKVPYMIDFAENKFDRSNTVEWLESNWMQGTTCLVRPEVP